MLTAKTGTEFYNEGLGAGAWDYIAKPFNSSQLRKKIDNIIETLCVAMSEPSSACKDIL